MTEKFLFGAACTSLLAALALPALVPGSAGESAQPSSQSQQKDFGTEEDVEFAKSVWEAMGDYGSWKMQSDVYPGTSPHGAFLRLYASYVNVGEDAFPVIVKDNYGGENASAEAIRESAEEHLGAVTIMVDRADDYRSGADDWFFVKYQPDGSIEETPDGKPLAGRVTSCVSCHQNAQGGDSLFVNDE